jgi:hypothetical protein
MKISFNKKVLLFFATYSLALAILPAAQAQFGGFGLGQSSGSSGADRDALAKATADVTAKVLAARIKFLDAQAKLMEALGLKNDSVIKASEALRAKEGATSSTDDQVSALKDSTKVSADADKQVDASIAQSNQLSDESKVKFAEGTGRFIQGVILEKEQVPAIRNLVAQGKSVSASASPFEKLKVIKLVRPVSALAIMVPGDVAEGTTTLGKIMKFCKTQNITNIPNSDKATANLGDL